MAYITVFTPTYNRAHTLPRLYLSLLEQTFRDFEWLVVDDGSLDDTPALLEGIRLAARLDMRWIGTENGGKHRAVNTGVREARGELFFIVDSDDTLSTDALEQIVKHYEQVRDDPSFAGVSGMKAWPDGRKVGSPCRFETLDCTSVEFRHKHRMKGDVAEAFRTDVLRRFPFPEYPGEKFVSEALVWNRIAVGHRLRYFNRNIYLCDYLPDGLTRSIGRIHRASPLGMMDYYASCARQRGGTPLSKVKAAIQYWRYTLDYRGHRIELPAWGYGFWPAGALFRILDKRKE